jgi:ubiquinone/menaquinone biosynthesis C-methylase UbiE
MQQAFDTMAKDYDNSFTNSITGRAQRNIVREYLEKNLPQNKKLNILELNCGTGEDALWFVKKNHSVLATDISEEMLSIVQKKIQAAGLESQISTLRLDINKIDHLDIREKFDLIFSNFGGINCIPPDDILKLPSQLTRLLNQNGIVIIVIMTSFCLWETMYFLAKFNINSAFRRISRTGSIANLNGSELRIFYYSPGDLKRIFGNSFKTNNVIPVGFFIPPSYLENFFAKHQTVFNWLKTLESSIRNVKFLSFFSDHYLIELQTSQMKGEGSDEIK